MSAEEDCPICQYIEAGPCSSQHVGWRVCKADAKKGGGGEGGNDGGEASTSGGEDWVERCQADFKSLLGCMLANKEYHEPLFEALHLDAEATAGRLAEDGDEGKGGGGGGAGGGGSGDSKSSGGSKSGGAGGTAGAAEGAAAAANSGQEKQS